MKKICMTFITVLMTVVCSFSVVAGQSVKEIANSQTIRTSDSVSRVGTPRGVLVSMVTSSITDEGGGTVGISASVMCHIPVEKIQMGLRLQHWDEDAEQWENVDTQIFTWTKEEFPINGLTEAIVSYKIPNLQRGQYYRLMGSAIVNEIDGDLREGWSLSTEELYVE